MSYSKFHSLNQYAVISIYTLIRQLNIYESQTFLEARNTEVSKTDMIPVLLVSTMCK